MIYDKNSFLSGIAVGRQLKGWGTPGDGSPWNPTITGLFGLLPAIPAAVQVSEGEIEEAVAVTLYRYTASYDLPTVIVAGDISDTVSVSGSAGHLAAFAGAAAAQGSIDDPVSASSYMYKGNITEIQDYTSAVGDITDVPIATATLTINQEE